MTSAHRILILALALTSLASSHPIEFHRDPFRQLEEVWPTPTESRIASGAPGPKYWQQQVDYQINISLNPQSNLLTGTQVITYHNNSPHTLNYLWMQLDRNKFTPGSMGHQTSESRGIPEKTTFDNFEALLKKETFNGGFNITKLADLHDKPLTHRINDTMMRIDLPQPLQPKQTFTYKLNWHYTITDSRTSWGRSNAETFKDGTKIYQVAQWFPRLCAYTDVRGWQNKPFLGRGEFALEFGNYLVSITTPDHHVVSSTGELQNPEEVLKPTWRERLKTAETADKPIFIITPEEQG